jgi:hypothetical protein
MLGFKCFIQKTIRGQFQVPEKFGIAPVEIWHNVLAARRLYLSATGPIQTARQRELHVEALDLRPAFSR